MALSRIEGTRVNTLIDSVMSKKDRLIECLNQCEARMVSLDKVYEGDAELAYKKALSDARKMVEESITAIVNSLRANAAQSVADYQAQDRNNANSISNVNTNMTV